MESPLHSASTPIKTEPKDEDDYSESEQNEEEGYGADPNWSDSDNISVKKEMIDDSDSSEHSIEFCLIREARAYYYDAKGRKRFHYSEADLEKRRIKRKEKTPAEREEERRKNRERAKKRRMANRGKSTPAELERKKIKRIQMSPAELEEYRRKNRESKKRQRAIKRAQMTPDATTKTDVDSEGLKAKTNQSAKVAKGPDGRAQWTPEQREEHKAEQYMRRQAYKARMTKEDLERQREKRREARAKAKESKTEEEILASREEQRIRRRNLTGEQRQRFLEQKKEYQRRRLERLKQEDPEKLEEIRLKNAEKIARRRALAKGLPPPPPRINGKNVSKPEIDKEQNRVRKFLNQRASCRRSHLRKKLTIHTLLENGVSMEEIQSQIETPELRMQRLLKVHKRQKRYQLRKSLREAGCSPEVMQAKLDEFEATYVPIPLKIRPYKPRPSKMKPLDLAELEKLEAAIKRRRKKTKVSLPETTGPLPITDSEWADPSKYGIPIVNILSTVSTIASSVVHKPSSFPLPPPAKPSSSSTIQQTQISPVSQHHQFDYQNKNSSFYPYQQQQQQTSQTPEPSQDHHEQEHSHQEYQSDDLHECGSSLNDDVSHQDQHSSDNDNYEPVPSPPPPQPKPAPIKKQRRAKKKTKEGKVTRKKSEKKPQQSKTSSKNATHVCDTCGLSFTLKYLRYHKLYKHNPDFVDGVCVPCKMRITSERAYQKHYTKFHKQPDERDPLRNFICDVCGSKFISHNNMQQHKHYVHGTGALNESRSICAYCGKSFKKKQAMYKHIRDSHPDMGYLSCVRCDKTYKNSDEYREHIKVDHPENFFPCEDCGKLKYSGRGLLAHFRQCFKREKVGMGMKNGRLEAQAKEMGIVPLQKIILTCEICGEGSSLPSLSRHYKEVHGIKEEEFKCDHCEKHFNTRVFYITHLEEFHGVSVDSDEFMQRISKYNVSDRESVVIQTIEKVKGRPIRKKKIKDAAEVDDDDDEDEGETSEDSSWSCYEKETETENPKVPKCKSKRPSKRNLQLDDDDDDDDEEDEVKFRVNIQPVSSRVVRPRRIKRGACDFPNIERDKRLVISVKRLTEQEIMSKCTKHANIKQEIVEEEDDLMS